MSGVTDFSRSTARRLIGEASSWAGFSISSNSADPSSGWVLVAISSNMAAWSSLSSAIGSNYVEAYNFGKEGLDTSTSVSGAYAIDGAEGNVHDLTLTGNATLTFTGATSGKACSFVLILRQNATGGYTVTWPGSVVWPGGNAPSQTTSALNVSLYTFATVDGGTTWYGFIAGVGSSVGAPSLASNSFSELALTTDASMALTSPDSSTLRFSAPYSTEVVVDGSGNIVYSGVDIVHAQVRIL